MACGERRIAQSTNVEIPQDVWNLELAQAQHDRSRLHARETLTSTTVPTQDFECTHTSYKPLWCSKMAI
jgi:hypothetical protein